ncbi:hypothetical protein ACFLXB_07225 [Chloroflexota bacterium]
MEWLKIFTPALGKRWHYIVNVFLWVGLGILLPKIASQWILPGEWLSNSLILLSGLAFGVIFYEYGFSRMAAKNIRRIEALPGEKHCIFGFHGWKLYPIILFMVLSFQALRVYSLVPWQILAVVYFAIGFSKLASSTIYIRKLISDR